MFSCQIKKMAISFTDVAKAMNVNPQFEYRYDIHLIQDLTRDIELLRAGQDVNYTPYSGSNLAFYLNLLYLKSNHYTQDFLQFVQHVVGLYWYQQTATEIIILLEVWVVKEMERSKLRLLEEQYENVIRAMFS
jgi:hypothetical protein